MRSSRKNTGKGINEMLVIRGEAINDCGEDWFVFSRSKNTGMICVLDGCGGIGSRKYDEYENKTGAYIASRVSANAIYEWFSEYNGTMSNNYIGSACQEIKKRIVKDLRGYEKDAGESLIKGSMTKSFPTTVSMVLFSEEADIVKTSFVWAGDSRGFVLTESGLMQMTKDDVEGESDAFDNLSDDSKLVNVVSANGNFELNHALFSFKKPVILIAATDGCFGYFSTPMEFEYMMINSIIMSRSIEGWKSSVEKKLFQISGDDYTMSIAILGYKDWKSLRKSFGARKMELYDKYISKLNDERTDRYSLWAEYKNGYYRGM